jgi:hypothetical protein
MFEYIGDRNSGDSQTPNNEFSLKLILTNHQKSHLTTKSLFLKHNSKQATSKYLKHANLRQDPHWKDHHSRSGKL